MKGLIEFVFSPVGIMVVLLAGGIAFSFFRRQSRTGNRLLIFGALLYLVFLFSPLAEILVANLESQYRPMSTPPQSPKIDWIVVLAGYGEENPAIPVTSSVSDQTMCCMNEGIRLYRLLPRAKLIMSGGVLRRGHKPVAEIMADFTRQLGVPPPNIVVEGNSQNTYENLVEVKKLVGSSPFILVAAACDLRRAVAVARKLQMLPFPAPACIWALQHFPIGMSVGDRVAKFLARSAYPSQVRLSRLQWAYHEYLGYVWYWLLDRV